MRKLLIIIIAISLFSCGSDKSVKRETGKSKQIVIQKFIDEYNKQYNVLYKNKSKNSINSNQFTKHEKIFNDYISSAQNIKMAKVALKLKDNLTESQVKQLIIILNNATKSSK